MSCRARWPRTPPPPPAHGLARPTSACIGFLLLTLLPLAGSARDQGLPPIRLGRHRAAGGLLHHVHPPGGPGDFHHTLSQEGRHAPHGLRTGLPRDHAQLLPVRQLRLIDGISLAAWDNICSRNTQPVVFLSSSRRTVEEEGSLGRTHTPPAEQPLLLSAPLLVTRDAGFSRPVCKTTAFLTLGKPRIRPPCELKFDYNFLGIKFK